MAGVLLIIVGACMGAACKGSSNATPTTKAGSTVPPAATVGTTAVTAATATNAPAASAVAGSFPQRCSDLVANADIDALALQHLSLLTDNARGISGSTSQLKCQFQGSGSDTQTAILVVAATYLDAAAASAEETNARATAQAQGAAVTTLTNIEDEAYAFRYSTLTGVSVRRGSRTALVGVGRLLGLPQPSEYTHLLQVLLDRLGS